MLNNFHRTKLFPTILLCSLLAYSLFLPPFPVRAEAAQTWSQLFNQQVTKWIDQVSQKDPSFHVWRQAKTDMQTLGAGQHQWLVHVTKGNQSIGYLIVGERPNQTDKPQFALLEYGLGEYAPFNPALAPSDDALPIYDGLSSRWQYNNDEGHIQSVNAVTGEAYPEGFTESESIVAALSSDEIVNGSSRLVQIKQFQLSSDEINPFSRIDWLTRKKTADQSAYSPEQLFALSDYGRLVLSASLYDQQVMAPFTLGAVHLWSDNLAYVGVWDESLRFLPYAYVKKAGAFSRG